LFLALPWRRSKVPLHPITAWAARNPAGKPAGRRTPGRRSREIQTQAKLLSSRVLQDSVLDASQTFEELKRCGYLPVRTFQIVRHAAQAGRPCFTLSGRLNEIIKISRQEKIECVFLLVGWDDRPSIDRLVEQLRILTVPIYLLPDSNVAHFLGSRIVSIGTTWTAELKRAPLTLIEQACKRALDLLIALTSLIILAPMMLLVAALIKIDSRGPVLFMQTRNGFNGRPFRIYKFRTMSVLEDGAVIPQASKNDPRFTRLGRLLRRANIDELPQLFNVIAGDMSLVGPRPHASAHNTEYERTVANYAFRYNVKPGLTGWAQIHGLRGETQTVDLMTKRVEYDLWYINNWSLWLDLKILFRTLTVGLQKRAY
jgi:Undecaprenyl-phosphate glucose phosphotransferase